MKSASIKKIFRTSTIISFSMLLFLYLPGCQKDSPTKDDGEADVTKTLNSLAKINDYPFYTMTYYGDYGFKNYLDTGTMPSFFSLPAAVNTEHFCTCFAAYGSDNCRLFGRNFDWTEHIGLLVYTNSSDGYSSMSMTLLEYLGYTDSNTPDAENNRQALLAVPYFPMDGVNEKGVAIGIMAVDHSDPPYTPGKRTLYTPFLIRLVLDYAADVGQAIDLIRQYNIDFSQGTPGHFLIADSTGHSEIVEFVDHDIKIVATTEKWQVSTNFNQFGTQTPENVSCWRYNKAYNALKQKQGNITANEAMTLLSQVTLGPPNPTMWSMVYDLKALQADAVINRNYSQLYRFSLLSH